MKAQVFFYLVIVGGAFGEYHVFTDKAPAIAEAGKHEGSQFWSIRKGALQVYLDLYAKYPELFFFHDETVKKLFEAQ